MNKSVLAKVLLLSLCFALVLVAFVGCGTKGKIEELNQQLEDTKTDLSGAKDENTKTNLALEELRATVDAIKQTADAAATATQLEAAVTELKGLIESNATADAATKAELQTVIADLTALINANGTTDAATKAELQAAIATLATKAELTAAVDELDAIIATLAATAELEAAVEELTALIDANAALDASDKAELQAALAAKADELRGLIDDNAALDATTKAALEADIADIEDAIADLDAAKADKTALEAAVNTLDTKIEELATATALAIEAAVGELEDAIQANADLDAETKAALEADIADIEDAIADLDDAKADKTALTDAVDTLNGKIDELAEATEAALLLAIETLGDAIEANTTLANDIKAELLAKIDAVDAAKADKTALEAAVATLNETIATLATKEELADAVEALENAIEANTTLANNIKTELLAEIADLADVVDGKATKAELEAAVDAIEDTIATLATKAELTTAVEQLTVLINANSTLANNIKTELLAEIADLAAVVDGKATKAELEAAVADLEGAIEDAKDELAAQIATLTGRFDTLSATVTGNIADVSALNTELLAIKERLVALEEKDFALAFKDATILLRGDDATYSLKAFNAVWEAYEAEQACYAEYDAFDAEMSRIHFYLLRAASVDEIKSLIDVDLAAAIEALEATDYRDNFPAWLESFIGTVTVDTDLSEVMAVFAILPPEVQAENQAEYDALLAAKATLVAAQSDLDVLNASIAAQGIVIYNTNTLEVGDFRTILDAIKESYFAAPAVDAEVLKYYATGDLAEDMLGNYDLLLEKEARVEELEAAYLAAVEIIDAIANYNTARPLFSDLEAITENKAAIEAWITEYALEDANVAAIYTATGDYDAYLLVDDALAYAETVAYLYGYYAVPTLNENIAALVEKNVADTISLIEDEAAVLAARATLDALKAAIEGVVDFDPACDGNYVAMVGDLTAFEAVELRIDNLNDAKQIIANALHAVAHYTDADEDGFLDITFDDYPAIAGFRAILDATYATARINEGDANYNDFAVAAEARYDELYLAYEHICERIVEIYDEAMRLLSVFKDEDGNYFDILPLSEGNNLIAVMKALQGIITEEGLTEVNLPLAAGEVEIDLVELYDMFFDIALEFGMQATLAESAAATLSANIATALADLSADDLKDLADVYAAYVEFLVWYNTYIDADFDGDVAGDAEEFADVLDEMRAAIIAIQEIEIIDIDDDVDLYVFVSSTEFEALIDLYVSACEKYTEAAEAVGAVKDAMAALDEVGEWNIHDDFDGTLALYEAFLDTYYAGAIAAAADYFDLIEAYSRFSSQYATFDYNRANAVAKGDAIKSKIDALGDSKVAIDFADLADVETKLAEIETLLGELCDLTGCAIDDSLLEEMCGDCIDTYLTDAHWIAFYRFEKRVAFTRAYADAYATADAATQDAILVRKTFYDNSFNTSDEFVKMNRVYDNSLKLLEQLLNPTP